MANSESKPISKQDDDEESIPRNLGIFMRKKNPDLSYLYRTPGDGSKCYRYRRLNETSICCSVCSKSINDTRTFPAGRESGVFELLTDPLVDHAPRCHPLKCSDVLSRFRLLDGETKPSNRGGFVMEPLEKRANYRLLNRSVANPDFCYKFNIRIAYGKKLSASCDSCGRRGGLCLLRDAKQCSDVIFLDDPVPLHSPTCKPLSYSESMTTYQEVSTEDAELFLRTGRFSAKNASPATAKRTKSIHEAASGASGVGKDDTDSECMPPPTKKFANPGADSALMKPAKNTYRPRNVDVKSEPMDDVQTNSTAMTSVLIATDEGHISSDDEKPTTDVAQNQLLDNDDVMISDTPNQQVITTIATALLPDESANAKLWSISRGGGGYECDQESSSDWIRGVYEDAGHVLLYQGEGGSRGEPATSDRRRSQTGVLTGE